ncbi:hypothetical protein Tco_0596567 [Tanacetum coccineum]
MASSLVLRQLFASRSSLITRSYRPVVATSTRFLSTSSSIRDRYNLSIGFPCYSACMDLFYKTVKCDSDAESSKDLKKGDRKAYIALSILGHMHYKENETSVMETGSCDLFRYIKGCKFDYKWGDFSLRTKDAVFYLCLPQWINPEHNFNKFEIEIMPALGTSSWFVRNSDDSLDNGGTYYTGDVSIKKLKEEDDHDEDDDWSMRLKDGVMNASIPKLKNKTGVPNKFELKFL